MPIQKRWTMRIAASLGCLALLAGTIVSAVLLIPHSWRDLDDAHVRMGLFRFHVYDPDFIAAAVAFGTTVLTVLAMFGVCLWMVRILIRHWNGPPGEDERQG